MMIEVVNELWKNSRSDSIIWEVEWSRNEVRVRAYHPGRKEFRSHAFSRAEVELSEVPLDKMVRALDKFKPFLNHTDLADGEVV